MNRSSNRFRFSVMICVWVLAASCLALQAQNQLERDFTVSAGGLLTVLAEGGSIEVTAGQGDTVSVQIAPRNPEQFQSRYEVSFDQHENSVRLEIKSREKLSGFFDWFKSNQGYFIHASVPPEFNVDLKTSGGSISVDQLRGEVFSKTSGGSLKFTGIEGDVVGKTSGGSIEVDDVFGKVEVATSGGSISVGRAGDNVQVKTSGGNITISEVSGALEAITSGGSIRAGLTGGGDCRLSTSGGNISVELTGDLGFQIDAKTSGGRVTASGMAIEGEVAKNRIKGRLNQGGPDLVLRTSGGSIRIESTSALR